MQGQTSGFRQERGFGQGQPSDLGQGSSQYASMLGGCLNCIVRALNRMHGLLGARLICPYNPNTICREQRHMYCKFKSVLKLMPLQFS